MTQNDKLIEVDNLHTHFFVRQGVVHAVDGATFSIERGKTLGVVGESGCGKSVTAQSIMRIVPSPGRIVEGEITLYRRLDSNDSFSMVEPVKLTDLAPNGREMRSVRGREISMIFQEPMSSFAPVYTIGNQVMESVLLHQDISKQEARERVIEMLARVGIPNAERNFDSYPHELSGGMRQRAMIAMALMCRPSLIIADEPTTAVDVTTEAQILALMKELQDEFGMAIMFITHDLGVIAQMAEDVVVMYMGKIVESADVDTIFHDPKHPYLRALLKSIPRIGAKTGKRLGSITGMVPDPFNIPSGCSFRTRCSEFIPGLCDVKEPVYAELDDGHRVACHLYARDSERDKVEDRLRSEG